MDSAMTQKELEEMLDRIVREVTEQATGVRLCPGGGALSEDVFTVHITFRKGFRTSLTLCADTALLVRMARNALEEEQLSPQDLEDFGKEYFNILCGKIAAVLFRNTKVPARFSVPKFYHGHYTPADHRMQFMLTYTNEHQEGAQLIHHVPRDREDGAEEI